MGHPRVQPPWPEPEDTGLYPGMSGWCDGVEGGGHDGVGDRPPIDVGVGAGHRLLRARRDLLDQVEVQLVLVVVLGGKVAKGL